MSKRVIPEISGILNKNKILDAPLISDSESDSEKNQAKIPKIENAAENPIKKPVKNLPSFQELAKNAEKPKFLLKKKEPDFIDNLLKTSILFTETKPEQEKPIEIPKLIELAQNPINEKSSKNEETEFDQAIKQIQSSNKIYKKLEKKDELRNKKPVKYSQMTPEQKEEKRMSIKEKREAKLSRKAQLGYNSEAYYRLQHDLYE